MKIQAAILHEKDAQFSIEECELVEPGQGEVLVEILACGICHTDLSVKQGVLPGEFPAILGHEGAGIIRKVGPGVTQLAENDHVVLTFGHCGTCSSCKKGEPAYCLEFAARNLPALNPNKRTTHLQNRKQLHGQFFSQSSFASHAIANETNAIKIRKDLPFHIAAPLGCGIQTGMGTVLNVLQPVPGQSIGIFGTGSVGLAAIMAAKISNCAAIVAVDIDKKRLEKALELGATHIIDASVNNPSEEIAEKFPELLHYIVEATGNPRSSENAYQSLGRKGVGAYVATPAFGTSFNVDMNMLVGRGRTLRGVIEGDSNPSLFIPQLAQYYMDGQLPLDKIVQKFPFSKINDAVAAIKSGEAIKAVLVCDEA